MGNLSRLEKARGIRVAGPDGAELMSCSFSLITTVLTALEQQGCTVSRTGVGTYVIQMNRQYKAVTVTFGVVAASLAQDFVISAIDLVAKTITIKQVTAASGTAVDTLTARVDFLILARTVS